MLKESDGVAEAWLVFVCEHVLKAYAVVDNELLEIAQIGDSTDFVHDQTLDVACDGAGRRALACLVSGEVADQLVDEHGEELLTFNWVGAAGVAEDAIRGDSSNAAGAQVADDVA